MLEQNWRCQPAYVCENQLQQQRLWSNNSTITDHLQICLFILFHGTSIQLPLRLFCHNLGLSQDDDGEESEGGTLIGSQISDEDRQTSGGNVHTYILMNTTDTVSVSNYDLWYNHETFVPPVILSLIFVLRILTSHWTEEIHAESAWKMVNQSQFFSFVVFLMAKVSFCSEFSTLATAMSLTKHPKGFQASPHLNLRRMTMIRAWRTLRWRTLSSRQMQPFFLQHDVATSNCHIAVFSSQIAREWLRKKPLAMLEIEGSNRRMYKTNRDSGKKQSQIYSTLTDYHPAIFFSFFSSCPSDYFVKSGFRQDDDGEESEGGALIGSQISDEDRQTSAGVETFTNSYCISK